MIDKRYTEELLTQLHTETIHNRAAIETAKECGCFYCLSILAPNMIVDWIDEDNTAMCPLCNVDAVITFNDEADYDLLVAMEKRWFNLL